MPYKSLNNRSVLTREQLQPDLRGKVFGSLVYGDLGSGIGYYIELAAELEPGDAISIDDDGKGIKAGLREAVAFTDTGGEIGSFVRLEVNKISSDRYNFVQGRAVWLKIADVNVTTNIPAFSDGDLVQRLGIATSTNEMIVLIAPARAVV